MPTPILELNDVSVDFDGFFALTDLSISLEHGELRSIIGPNGAGKTTLFNVIAGLHKPTSGHVLLDGEDITNLPPQARFHKGILVAEGLFSDR